MAKKPEKSAEPAESAELPAIFVTGDFADRMTTLTLTATNLLLGIGRAETNEQKMLLVPYLEISWDGGGISEVENPRRLHSQTMGIENWSFALADMTRDLLSACELLRDVSGGAVRPDAARMEQARMLIGHGSENLAKCREAMMPLGIPAGQQ